MVEVALLGFGVLVVLLTLGGERPQLEGGMKYVALNFLSSALFLAAVGILYGFAGTLNMADLALVLRSQEHAGITNTVDMLFLVAFGITFTNQRLLSPNPTEIVGVDNYQRLLGVQVVDVPRQADGTVGRLRDVLRSDHRYRGGG